MRCQKNQHAFYNIGSWLLIVLLAFCTACAQPEISRELTSTSSQHGTASATEPVDMQQQQVVPGKQAAEEKPVYPVTVIDGLGRKVTIERLPERIVSLAPSNTEILFALGLNDEIVGVTDYCDFPDEAKTKTRVAGYSTPDLERLVSLKPDLILAESIQEKTVLPVLERLGMTVFTAEALTLNSILEHITAIGKMTGRATRASELVESMRSRIDVIESKTKNLPADSRLRVLYVNWHDPIWTMGRNTYIDDIINKAGGVNIYAADFEKSRAVSLESVINKNPQVIFVSGMGTTGDAVFNGLKNEVRLYSIDAVKNNRIYKISNANFIERPGPRIVEGMDEVSKMIHPEIFGQFK